MLELNEMVCSGWKIRQLPLGTGIKVGVRSTRIGCNIYLKIEIADLSLPRTINR